jgi:penicillin-binding protein 1C
VIPQNPGKRVPNRGVIEVVRNQLYSRWLKQHPEDNNKKPLFALPLSMRSLHAIPFKAPHFVNEVLMDATIKNAEINTTLDMRLQQVIERVTRNYIARKKNVGVNNAAVLLVDTRDMGVKAMLGSADFFDKKIGGQMNGTDIRRSPGSTLKPFIYALALQQGLIHPATILKDVPHSFGSYNPENFDNDFMGPVHAKDALVLSRNIPAITLAEKLKNPSLYDFMQQANVQHLKSENYYGLALVLGGAELSMQELVTLYATLANEGIWKPLRFDNDATDNLHRRLLSSEAAFLVMDMLKDTQLPDANFNAHLRQPISIAWKTGTSSGYRDAWTVGMFGPYVLAVWIGNFDNEGNPIFIGKKIAAPLFFEMVNAIKMQVKDLAVLNPNPERMNLRKVDVCKSSGMLPTRYCPLTEKVWFIPGVSPIQSDTIYREVAINPKTGLRACRFNEAIQFKVYEFWSSDLLRIFKRAGIQRRLPPPYDADCALMSKVGEGFSPQIISPQTQLNYIARLASLKETIIPLTAVVDADVRNIYWFLNDSFLGKTTRDKSLLWHAKPGKHVIRMVDDFGRSDVREVVVQAES